MHTWTEQEIRALKMYFTNTPISEIAAEVFPYLSINQIKYKGKQLGLLACSDRGKLKPSVKIDKSREAVRARAIANLKDIDMECIEYNGTTKLSTLKCCVCGFVWQDKIAQVIDKEKDCKVCVPSQRDNYRGPISGIATEWLDLLGIDIREFTIPGTRFRVDGMKDNIVYEFLGDYWHGNPEIYGPFTINKLNGKTCAELYKQTINRINEIRGKGYKVFYIWENEFHKGLEGRFWSDPS